MTAPVPVSPIVPIRLELNAGYTSVKIGTEQPAFSGPHYGANLRYNFDLHPSHSLFVGGAFRHAFLENSINKLSMVHFGAEAGYEAWLAPKIFSLHLFAGLGANIFYSEDLNFGTEGSYVLDNKAEQVFTLGGGLTLGRRIFILSGAYQPSKGLNLADPGGINAPRPFSTDAYFLQLGLDLVALTEWGGGKFPMPPMEHFGEGLALGVILDGSYTYNFGKPETGENALRIFDTANDRPMFNLAQFSLVRETDEKTPLGLGMVLDTGENPNVSGANESLNGENWDMQQLWGEVRLPIGEGLTLRGGKFATIIGYEVIEPINNQLSRSWAFGLAIPFTHIGVLAAYPFSEKFTMKAGVINGWDNVLGHETGPAGLAGVFADPVDIFSWSLSGAAGANGDHALTVLDAIGIFKTPDEKFSIALNLDWGHEGSGGPDNLPAANWVAASLNPRYDFNHFVSTSGRVEVFHDPQGARTGGAQTLTHGALTFHLRPIPEESHPYSPLEIRTELRHDMSSDEPFLAGAQPAGSQTTLALGATLAYENLLGLGE